MRGESSINRIDVYALSLSSTGMIFEAVTSALTTATSNFPRVRRSRQTHTLLCGVESKACTAPDRQAGIALRSKTKEKALSHCYFFFF